MKKARPHCVSCGCETYRADGVCSGCRGRLTGKLKGRRALVDARWPRDGIDVARAEEEGRTVDPYHGETARDDI